MVKSETRQDAEILVRNPSPRLFGEKFRDSKKVKTNHEKTRLRDLSKTLLRFRDSAKIFRDPRFSRYHSSPLIMAGKAKNMHQATVVQKVDNVIQRINLYPLDSAIGFPKTYPLDSDF